MPAMEHVEEDTDGQRHRRIDEILPGGDHDGWHLLRQRPPQHLPHRISESRAERQQRCRFENTGTGPHHDEHADEARDDGKPAVQPHPLMQQRPCQPSHEERHGEVDCHSIGNGNGCDGEHEAQIGGGEDNSPEAHPRPQRRGDGPATPFLPEDEGDDRQRAHAAEQQRLIGGITG